MTDVQDRGRQLVVAVDFSDPSIEALDEALRRLADRPGSELHVVHVVEDPGGIGKTTRLRNENVLLSELPDRLRRLIADRARALSATMPPSHVGVHVRFGPTVPTVLQLTVDVDADELVVGTHGRTGVKRAVMGSVAEQLIRRARCPILVARSKDYEGLEHTEEIEPPCEECLAKRRATGGAEWWCDTHARERVHAHAYSSAGSAWTRGMADFHGFGSA